VGEQLGNERRLVRHDLIAGFGMIVFADVSVAERAPATH
jgi:hypothetical protein